MDYGTDSSASPAVKTLPSRYCGKYFGRYLCHKYSAAKVHSHRIAEPPVNLARRGDTLHKSK